MSDVAVVSVDAEVRELVGTAAAGLGKRVAIHAPTEAAAAWQAAGAVFVGIDAAPEVASLALPKRDRVYVVGRDLAATALWSVPLGAGVIALPEGRRWLSSVLAETADDAAEVTVVLGGSGGVGASTLVAALCWSAVRASESVSAVDLDRTGGGLDLLFGAERLPGWRWPRLGGAEGVLGDLREFLPVADGVAVVAMARGPDLDLAREPVAAVLGSLRRSFDRVVVDAGRQPTPAAREALRLATRTVMVVAGTVRGVAAAGQTLAALEPRGCSVVVRRIGGAAMPSDAVEQALGVPVVGTLRHQSALVAAAERGERPGLSSRPGGIGRVCTGLLETVVP